MASSSDLESALPTSTESQPLLSDHTSNPQEDPAADPAANHPQLPMEIIEMIIDIIGENINVPRIPLLSCALTCRSWYPRSQMNLVRRVLLQDRHQIFSFSHLLFKKSYLAPSVESMTLKDPFDYRPRKSDWEVQLIDARRDGTATPFPLLFAGRLPNLREVYIGFQKLHVIHPSFFRALSEFTSITTLTLEDVSFERPLDFNRLICALPNLTKLSVWLPREPKSYTLAHPIATRHFAKTHLKTLVLLHETDPGSIPIIRCLLLSGACVRLETLDLTCLDSYHGPKVGLELRSLFEACRTSLKCLKFSFTVVNLAIKTLLSYSYIVPYFPHLRILHIRARCGTDKSKNIWLWKMVTSFTTGCIHIGRIILEYIPGSYCNWRSTSIFDVVLSTLHQANCAFLDDCFGTRELSSQEDGLRINVYTHGYSQSKEIEDKQAAAFRSEVYSLFSMLHQRNLVSVFIASHEIYDPSVHAWGLA